MKKRIKRDSFLVCVLSVCLIIAVLVACISITGHILKSSISIKPKPDVIIKEPDSGVILEGEFDFNDSIVFDKQGTKYTSENIIGWVNAGDVSVNDGSLHFTYTTDDYEAIIASGANKASSYVILCAPLEVDTYPAIMYDVDVKLSSGFPISFGIRPDFRDTYENGSFGTTTVINESTISYVNGNFCPYNSNDVLYSGVPEEYHYTFILWRDGTASIYVDGNFVCKTEKVYNENTTVIPGLRISLSFKEDVSADVIASFDNVQITSFSEAYDGTLLFLKDNHTIKLQEVSDSVLYEAKGE
ncbi:MAG: hypothetical protein IJY01_03780 [Clostridia bacterium]|nr:hypothetical protein [Clostridia bacterium]